jgi:hypothetical protein
MGRGRKGLDLILSQYIDTSLKGWAGLCPLVGETQKGPLPEMGTSLCERDPHVHLRGNYYPILTGCTRWVVLGKSGWSCSVQGIGRTREGATLSERIKVSPLCHRGLKPFPVLLA